MAPRQTSDAQMLGERQARSMIKAVDAEIRDLHDALDKAIARRNAVFLISDLKQEDFPLPTAEVLNAIDIASWIKVRPTSRNAKPYRDLASVAQEVLMTTFLPMSLKDLFEAVTSRGVEISGKRPDAKLWAALNSRPETFKKDEERKWSLVDSHMPLEPTSIESAAPFTEEDMPF